VFKREEEEDGIVEYVPERLDVDDSSLDAFSDVFARFQLPEEEETNVCHPVRTGIITHSDTFPTGVQRPSFDKGRYYLFR